MAIRNNKVNRSNGKVRVVPGRYGLRGAFDFLPDEIISKGSGSELWSLRELLGFSIRAVDGICGTLNQLLFEDRQWIVLYLGVNVGKWYRPKLHLIAPKEAKEVEDENQLIYVMLTRDQIKKSPGIDNHQPVSRQEELEFRNHFRWPFFWTGAGTWGIAPTEEGLIDKPYEWVDEIQKKNKGIVIQRNLHLRSSKEVLNCRIEASDAYFGHVEDLIVDSENWEIRYLVIDTRNWIPGKYILLPPRWVESINWSDRRIKVSLKREKIEQAPVYRFYQPITPEYEEEVWGYFGKKSSNFTSRVA